MRFGGKQENQMTLSCLALIHMLVEKDRFNEIQYGPYKFGIMDHMITLASPSTNTLGTKFRTYMLEAFRMLQSNIQSTVFFEPVVTNFYDMS